MRAFVSSPLFDPRAGGTAASAVAANTQYKRGQRSRCSKPKDKHQEFNSSKGR